jgi:hypothetical protein
MVTAAFIEMCAIMTDLEFHKWHLNFWLATFLLADQTH